MTTNQRAVDYLQDFTVICKSMVMPVMKKPQTSTHLRRKFIEAQTAQPKGKTGADIALIQKLYRLEILKR